MKIHNISIQNFRGISNVELKELGELVVIAGPNGCGKSSIFDAIRLLKSAYGGYQVNEMDQWINEFQLNFSSDKRNVEGIFRNKSKPIVISADFSLSSQEIEYLKDNGDRLLKSKVLSSVSQPQYLVTYKSLASGIRWSRAEMQELLTKEAGLLAQELQESMFKGQLTISPEPEFRIDISTQPVLELIFSSYLPKEIGIIDYHGPHRNYNREKIGGVNLTIESEEQRMSQHALYNYAGKYSNVKSEMAGAYIRELIAKESGITIEQNTLSNTLTELFQTFFPDKQFLGPQPAHDGNLNFPVKLSSGDIHDIDELSTGEKEIIYGYLRLRNNTPRNSVLLLDEPELHLNPRLIRGLPQFYNKHLGRVFENQIWLVTHSDAFLRESVGQPGFSVFHMQLPEPGSENNQAHNVNIAEDLERAIIDLIGDLATYHPGAKVVIFEGGGDSEFDLTMTTALFPELSKVVNPISGSSKKKVKELHEILKSVVEKSQLPMKFFSIVDRDSQTEDLPTATEEFQWNVYHIENYLLEEEFILKTLKELDLRTGEAWNESRVRAELETCARETLSRLVGNLLRDFVNDQLIRGIHISFDPNTALLSEDVFRSVVKSFKEVSQISAQFTLKMIGKKEQDLRQKYEKDLSNGNWKKTFIGRDILRLFAGRHAHGIPYKNFRDLIISKMMVSGYKPKGMKKIIDEIILA